MEHGVSSWSAKLRLLPIRPIMFLSIAYGLEHLFNANPGGISANRYATGAAGFSQFSKLAL